MRALGPPRVHVAATSSPLSELRLDASEGVGATDAWRQICGPPAGFTPTSATLSMARAG